MKVDRLVGMLMLLLEKERISARELADLYEVSPRTIYRDIDAIGRAGIPVRATPGVGGGFEIMRQYKVDRKVFSAADLSAILTGLSGLSGLSGLIRGEELVNALAKVRSFIPADRAKDIALRANQIHIDVSPWVDSGNIRPNLETVKTALQENRLLSFSYTDRHGNKTARTAEPYQLVLKGSRWYWQGYCHTRNDFRLFRLSRMSGLRIQEETFTPREYPEPQLEFAEILEILRTTVKIRIHRSVMERVLDNCAEESFTPDGDGYYIVDFPFVENDYYYELLLGFGDRCECLEPPHIRAEIRRRIRAAAAFYEK